MSRKLLRYAILIGLPVMVVLIFTANYSLDLFTRQRFNAAHQQWNTQRLTSYQMQVRAVTGLGWSVGPFPLGDFQVTVKDGKVIAAGERNWLASASDPNTPYRPIDSLDKVSVLTMDQIFDQVQNESTSDLNIYSCGQERVEAQYDAAQGYVRSLTATCAGGWLGCGVSDCGGSVAVQNLKPLNP